MKRQKLDVQICAGKHVYALDFVRDTQHTHLRACVCAHTHAQTHTNKPSTLNPKETTVSRQRACKTVAMYKSGLAIINRSLAQAILDLVKRFFEKINNLGVCFCFFLLAACQSITDELRETECVD